MRMGCGAGWTRESLPVTRHEQVSNLVFLALRSGTGALADLPPERRSSEALFGQRINPTNYVRDVITLTPVEAQGPMTAGFVPVSPDLEGTVLDGFYYPFSGTFRIEMPTNGYTWSTGIRGYTQQQYRSAAPASDPTYLQLPPDLPQRVRLLAQQSPAGTRRPTPRPRRWRPTCGPTTPTASLTA